MTMLDRMRRHQNWLKWSLALVCLAFVIFYIPDFLRNPSTAGTTTPDVVASVDGHDIPAGDFLRAYQSQLNSYRAQYGSQMNERLLKQIGIDQQILQQLVDEESAVAEARRAGIRVTDAEVAQRIYTIPALMENGAFIGQARYQQLLASQRPPLTVTEFEESIRRSILVDKLRASVTDWMAVSDAELQTEYRRRNDKVTLSVVAFNADSYRPDITVSDADASAYFDAHKDAFKVGEKRKVKYVMVDVEALRAKVTVTPAELAKAYNEGMDQFSQPEQVRASHILLKTEGKDDAAVKAQAEDVLKQAKGGADFAALAAKYSQDDSNAKSGGDLDFFGRGRMVPEFDAAVFAIPTVGEIVGPVKTQFGYHIIKLTEKRAATVKPLEEVKQQLTEQVSTEKAQQQAGELAQKLQAAIKTPADLEKQAAANGLKVEETGFFLVNEPIVSVGASPEMSQRAFALKEGEVSGAVRTGRGVVFETVSGTQAPYIPKFDEVKDAVRDTVTRQRAVDVAKQKAADLVAKLRTGMEFDKAAKAVGLEAKSTEPLARDGAIPELGAAPAVMDRAFSLSEGSLSDVIATDNGAAVIKVLTKAQTSDADFASAKDAFRQEILNDRRGRFFAAYMGKAKQKMKITVNGDVIRRIVG